MTKNLENIMKFVIYINQGCKLPDSEYNRYFYKKQFHLFPENICICIDSFVDEAAANDHKWHMENFQLDREI